MKTSSYEICSAEIQDETPISLGSALINPGVYRFQGWQTSAALVVVDGKRIYHINDNVCTPFKQGIVSDSVLCRKTLMPVPTHIDGQKI